MYVNDILKHVNSLRIAINNQRVPINKGTFYDSKIDGLVPQHFYVFTDDASAN